MENGKKYRTPRAKRIGVGVEGEENGIGYSCLKRLAIASRLNRRPE
jgi:hypothetical protein